MGLFSGLKKIGKSIFKGVKKVFKKVMKVAGKIMNSKWGKALLLASAVFTGGVALAAGFSGFAGTTGTFMTKFVAGGKAFMTALASPVASAKKLVGGAQAAVGQAGQVAGAAKAAGAVEQASAAGEMIGAAGQAAKTGSNAAQVLSGGTQAAGQMGQAAGGVAQQAGGGFGGMLSKAAKGAMDFVKSPAGGQVLSSAVKGFAAGKQQEEMLKEEERVRRYYDNQWRDPSKLAQLDQAVAGGVNVPGGYLDRAKRVSEFLNTRQHPYPTQAGNPDQVASYAVSPGAQ